MILCGTTPVPHRCAALVCAVTGAPVRAYYFQPGRSEVILPPSSPAAFHQNGGSLGSLDGVLVLFTAFVSVSFGWQRKIRFCGAGAAPGLRFVSSPYASKASSPTLPGTPPAAAKLLRTPEGSKGWDGKAAARRRACCPARARTPPAPLWGPLGRVFPCQPKLL